MGARKETQRHRIAFEVWYSANRSMAETLRLLRAQGWKISERTLYRWRERFEWDRRADELDAQVARKRMQELVEEQAAFFRRLVAIGRELQVKALEYLRNNGLGNAHTALTALRMGVTLEQRALGLPDVVELILGDEHGTKVRAAIEVALEEVAGEAPGFDAGPAADDGGYRPTVIIRPAATEVEERSNGAGS